MTEELFSEFNSTTKQDWLNQVSKEIKESDILKKLKSRLWDQIQVNPFYTNEDLKSPVLQYRFNPSSDIPGFPPRIWNTMVNILSGDSNSYILNSLENGAEGLILHLHGIEDLSELLQGVHPEYIPIIIKPLGDPILVLNSYFYWVNSTGASPESITGGLHWTPSDIVFEKNKSFEFGLEILSELIEMTEDYSNFKTFCVKTSRYTESGANPLDSITFALGEFIEVIDQLSLDPKQIFSSVFLDASLGEHHFGEIARLKAFRSSFKHIAALYSLDLREEDFLLFCQTSQWSKSILDKNTNLIRQTFEAMAAILGGANWLSVNPIQEEKSTEMERRICKNVSIILREESYFDKVMDPSAGSYYLENLIFDISQTLKQKLTVLENNGGWAKAMKKKEIHRAVRSQRERTQEQIAQSMVSKIGVNKFPETRLTKLILGPLVEKNYELKPSRASYLAELQILNES
jgi:methylmalonyl-CoA mutase